MEEFSRYVQQNYAWVIAGAISLLALIVSVASFLMTRRRGQKAFSYQYLTNIPLVSKRSEASGKIRILYEDKPVESVRLVQVELRNSGGKEIEVKDFWDSVRLVFPEGMDLYEPEVVQAFPDGFTPEIEQEDSTIVLKPVPMNAGDWLVIKVLVPTEERIYPKVKGRIAGVGEVTPYQPPGERVELFLAVVSLTSLPLLAFMASLGLRFSFFFPFIPTLLVAVTAAYMIFRPRPVRTTPTESWIDRMS